MLKTHSLNCIFELYSKYNQIHRKCWKIVLLRLHPLLAPYSLFVVSRQQRGDILTVQFMVLACKVYNLGLENFQTPANHRVLHRVPSSLRNYTARVSSSYIYILNRVLNTRELQRLYSLNFLQHTGFVKNDTLKNNVACWNLLQVIYIKFDETGPFLRVFDEFRKDAKGKNDPMWFSANQTLSQLFFCKFWDMSQEKTSYR